MKMQGFLGEEDFQGGDHVLLDTDSKVYTVISVDEKKGLLITDWENPNGPYWEKAANCFKKESAPTIKSFDYC